MKNIRNIALVTCAVISIVATANLYYKNSAVKVAYLNVPKLLLEYDAMKVVKGKLEIKAGEYRANMDSLRADFDRLAQKYNKEKATMSAKEKELSIQLLDTKSAEFL